MRKNIFNLLISFKKANSTLGKQKQYKQAQDLSKIVKHDQSLYEQIVKELKLKVANWTNSKTIVSRPQERA